MKTTLRVKFMKWLMIQTLLVFAAFAIVLYFFNLHEQEEHPQEAEEEQKEFYIMIGLMALTAPLILISAWSISHQLLKPLQAINRSAEIIRSGNLKHRIDSDVADDEIGKLAITINGAFDSYHHALNRLDRFSYDAAHQLRNPLAAIRAEGEVCLHQPRSAEQYRDAIGKMLEDAKRLNHTVSQLLTLARLDRGQLASAFVELDLAGLVREALADFEPVIESMSIQFQGSLPQGELKLQGVPGLLREAVVNLLDNAVRHTPVDGRVVVGLRRENAEAVLVVEDSGPGIPVSMREQLFDRTRGASGSTREGAGLGLAIAADVIRVHGGTIKATTSGLGGAMFAIRLPCR